MRRGDIVLLNNESAGSVGVGIVLEVLNGGYARKNASALVYWSQLECARHHAVPDLKVLKS